MLYRRKKLTFAISSPDEFLYILGSIFSKRIIDDWNKLPADVDNSCSVNIFKNTLEFRYYGEF